MFCLVNAAWSVQISLLIQTRTLFTGGSIIMDYILSRILVKNVLMLDLFQLLSSQDVNWWTEVVWITCGLLWCFISCLDSHSDGTHSLQSIHCWDTDAVTHFLQIWWRNKLIYILDGLRVSKFSANFHFWHNDCVNAQNEVSYKAAT